MSPDIERAIERLQADGKTRLISVSQAMGLTTPRSLLVMVDHSKISLTLSKEFYEQFKMLLSLIITEEMMIFQIMLS